MKDFAIVEGRDIIAEALSYRVIEKALKDFIEDPESKDAEIELADGFLCLMYDSKKKFLKLLKEREEGKK